MKFNIEWVPEGAPTPPTETFKVVIDGFHTKEQAEAFIDWYQEMGEQDAGIWLDENCPDTPVCTDMHSPNWPPRQDGNSLTIVVK